MSKWTKKLDLCFHKVNKITSLNTYHIQACDVERQIICQWNKDGKPIEPEVIEDYPPGGGCPDNWFRYRNRCFLYNGLTNAEDRKNFTDAEADCVTKGGHLASVYDEYYNGTVVQL